MGGYVGFSGKPEELKCNLSVAVYYDKTGFTRSVEFVGRYGKNSKKKNEHRRGLYLF